MKPEIDKVYRHYKGGYYIVLDIARNTESNEVYVIYKKLDDDEESTVWARPYENWEKPAVVDGVEVERFEKLDPELEFGSTGAEKN